ncbi:MAG: ribonuclease G [Chlamydiae bacterium CG10_big_fil_rev_8_21_14_0_10_42_34]|nr:MAG: ribonuclease G [Chlamydiae bacterium CG10_big_fil_rev_8_21_14_0_10_42_34]
MHEILLNIESKEVRYALLKHGQLHDLIFDRKKSRQITGNVYRGRVTNILQNIQSAFIDINEGENGFIHISDILENSKKFEEMFDMDFDLNPEKSKPKDDEKAKEITQLLKNDQPVLVQVVKEPIGTKGARLTSNISIAGRYLVLLPNNPHRGVSRKIEDKASRERLKKIIRSFEMPQDMGLICRTASSNATTDQLIDEATELLQNWQTIVEKFNNASKPTLLFEESDLIKRVATICVDKKIDRLLIDDHATYLQCKSHYQKFMGEHPLKIEFYRDKTPMFERFNVEKEIDRAVKRKIWLGSGGYLFFDRTEAMHTIDVNSGRSSTNQASGDVEETLVRINLEAAEEIARQLRVRNVGGLIICDFIDMRSRKNQRRVLDRLKECMKEDSAKCTILGMSEFGLVEMTRQRSRESLSQTIYTGCPYCASSGLVKSHESVSVEIERALKKAILCHNQFALKLIVHPELNKYLDGGDKDYYGQLAGKSNAHIEFAVNDNLHLNEFIFYSSINGQKIET